MRILIDICHPAHAHFFRNPVEILRSRNHKVVVTSRRKEVTLTLLDKMGWAHHPLSSAAGGKLGLLGELILRNFALFRIARDFRPDCMAAIGGIFIAQVGALSRIPSLVFYDTENARIQNRLTYPFASLVVVPRCYEGWLPQHALRYPGYHELSYLHPAHFKSDRKIAIANGLDPKRDTYLVRLVAWKSNHDIGEQGWDSDLLNAVIDHLSPRGKVIISSESSLPEKYSHLTYRGDPMQIHHLMAHCRLHIGESATMASESAVLGVPAVYAAETGRGYTNEQEIRYGLVKNVHAREARVVISAIDRLLNISPATWNRRHRALIEDTIEVASYTANLIEQIGGKRFENTMRTVTSSKVANRNRDRAGLF
jgi:predicted glycosyltransferase